jgi:inorganic pyrophosphatase
MHPWHDIPLPPDLESSFPVVIEVPRGSRNKYELDKDIGILKVDRVLYSAVHYPANYGFIPRTYCDDGDPLDVLVLGADPVHPLTLVTARALGGLSMRDDKGIDDKIIAVHVNDPAVADYRDIAQLPRHTLAELKRFFEDYKVLEQKTVVVEDFYHAAHAVRVIREAVELYARTPGLRTP